MTTVSFTTNIACSPDQIFDLLSASPRNTEWSPGFAGAQKTSG